MWKRQVVIASTYAHQHALINCSKQFLHKKHEQEKPWKALGIA